MVTLMCSHDRKVRSFAKYVLGSMRCTVPAKPRGLAAALGPIHLYHQGRSDAPPDAPAAPKPVVV